MTLTLVFALLPPPSLRQLDYEDYEDSEDEGEGSNVEGSQGTSSPASSTVSFHSATEGAANPDQDLDKVAHGLGLVSLADKEEKQVASA